MATEISAVLQSKGRGERLSAQHDELSQPAFRALQVIVADTGEPDRIGRRVLATLAERPRTTVVTVPPRGATGAVRNAALEAVTTDLVLFVDPGFSIAPGYLEAAQTAFEGSADLGFVTSWFERRLPGDRRQELLPPAATVETLLGDPECVHACTVFRSSLLRSLGGFDPELDQFEIYEMALRELASGSRGEVVQQILVIESSGESGYRQRLERHRRLPTLSKIYQCHRDLFEAHPDVVLLGRERQLSDLAPERQKLLARRADSESEHQELDNEIQHLVDELAALGEARVDWGDLRRTTPLSSDWGYDRGLPIDRRYIEDFLSSHADDIHGSILEVQEADYSRRFGAEGVKSSDVVDLSPDNPRAHVVADLRQAANISANRYDCVILTQTAHVIDDMASVVSECYRILKPGGTLLLTVPCVSRVCLEYGPEGDFWRLTEAGTRALFYEVFPPQGVETRVYGNVMTATAFLYGLATDELSEEEFADTDPYHPLLIGVRAVKPKGDKAPAVAHSKRGCGVILGYHRVAAADSDIHSMCVAPDDFQGQMEHLSRECTPLPLAELLTRAQAADLPSKAVAVTFDDGYLDALATASPILVDLGIPASFFVSVEAIDSGRAYWWDRLERMFLSGLPLPDRLELRWRGEDRSFATDHPESRQQAHQDLYELFIRCPPAQRDDLERQLQSWAPESWLDDPDSRSLNLSELTRLAEHHVIGAHSVHHLALSHQTFDTQQREIFDSKSALEDLLDRPVTLFAYPYGDVSDSAAELVRAASYEAAVTCEQASVDEWPDPFRLPRWAVPTDDDLDFDNWLDRCFGGNP